MPVIILNLIIFRRESGAEEGGEMLPVIKVQMSLGHSSPACSDSSCFARFIANIRL